MTSTTEDVFNLAVHLYSEETADVEQLNRQLQKELRGLEKVKLQMVQTEKPFEGEKSGLESIDWTTLIVTLAASGGVLTTVINAIQSRLTRERSVTLEIDGDKLTVTGISSEYQQPLIDDWLERHRKRQQSNANDLHS